MTLTETLFTLKTDFYVTFAKEETENGDGYFASACLYKRDARLDEGRLLAGVSATSSRDLAKVVVLMLTKYEACE